MCVFLNQATVWTFGILDFYDLMQTTNVAYLLLFQENTKNTAENTGKVKAEPFCFAVFGSNTEILKLQLFSVQVIHACLIIVFIIIIKNRSYCSS